MAKEYTLKAVTSLFEEKLSERSGLVKDVKAAESILRELKQQPLRDTLVSKQAKDLGTQVRGFLFYS